MYLGHVRRSVLKTLTWLCNPHSVLVFAHADREEETVESVEETFSDLFEPLGKLRDVETVDPKDLGGKARKATVFAFRVRGDGASKLGMQGEEVDSIIDGQVDRSEMCSVCGGPVSVALKQQRGVCDACM